MGEKLADRVLGLGLALAILGLPLGVTGEEPEAGIMIRTLTPEEVKKQLEQEDARIAAEPSIEGLPPRLSYHIRTRFPALSVLTRGEAREDNLRFARDELGQSSPFVCSGDFDGNGLEDAAVIVRDQATGKLTLMAFHQFTATVNPGGLTTRAYQPYRVRELGPASKGAKLDMVVICNKPGEFEVPEGGVTLRLRNHSISLGFYLHFFLIGEGYHSLLIGD